MASLKRGTYKGVFFHHSSGSRRGVLFLHGLGGTGYSFRRFFPLLREKNIPFIATDHPYHGYTKTESFEEYCLNTKKAADLLMPKGYDICAHSFGAYFANRIFNLDKADKKLLLFNPLLEIKNQSKGIGEYLYSNLQYYRYISTHKVPVKQKWRYPDYAKLGNKAYICYWLSDMTHVDINGYFKTHVVAGEHIIKDFEWLDRSEVHLGRYDIITYSDLTHEFLKRTKAKVIIHNAEHLYPLKHYKDAGSVLLNFISS